MKPAAIVPLLNGALVIRAHIKAVNVLLVVLDLTILTKSLSLALIIDILLFIVSVAEFSEEI